ncbi:MAG: Panacea domain-containing protein [Eubacteriales bacterium]|jgi:uncharacterized phage-associated protein
MAYSAVELSKYIVTKCANDKCPITNLQLQKILYYIQKDYLSRNELAFDDLFEAWQFGPVIRQVYYYFCGNGAMPIISKYDTVIDKSDRCHVDPIVEEKRKLDPWDLVEDTHKQGRAWSKVFNHGQGNKHIIDNDLIRRLG